MLKTDKLLSDFLYKWVDIIVQKRPHIVIYGFFNFC